MVEGGRNPFANRCYSTYTLLTLKALCNGFAKGPAMQVFGSGFALLLAALQGEAHVATASTLVLGITPVRLAGIAVPDPATPEGAAARAEMQAIVAGHAVVCRSAGERHGALYIATCHAGEEDIAAALVTRGHAIGCPDAPAPDYRALEQAGQRQRLAAMTACRSGPSD
jgi:endonuclease YncB( thermonuclease family)